MVLVVLTRHWLFAVVCGECGLLMTDVVLKLFSLSSQPRRKRIFSPVCFHLGDLRLLSVIE